MFNINEYQAAIEKKMVEVRSDPSHAWKLTLDARYTHFCLLQAHKLLTDMIAAFPVANAATDKNREGAMRAIMMGVANVHTYIMTGSAMLNGVMTLKDPVRHEAMLRLWDEARKPKAPAND